MSALRSGLKTTLWVHVNALLSSMTESEAAYGWSVPGMFSRENSDTFLYLLFASEGMKKSTKTEVSLKCSYMARGRWKDVVFHSRGMHSVLMQKHCMRVVPHIMQDGVTLWQCHLEVGCSSSNHRKAGELKGGEKTFLSLSHTVFKSYIVLTYFCCCLSN